MKPFLLFCLVCLLAGEAKAMLDLDGGGLSDVFEYIYFRGPVRPDADADGDGWSNREEMAWGTDPTDPRSTVVGGRAVLEGANLVLTWPTVAGKQYLLQVSVDLVHWSTVLEGPHGRYVEVLSDDPTGAAARFWRVQVMATGPDTNRDGFDDWEEDLWAAAFGAKLDVADQDGDGLVAGDELRVGRDPAKRDHPAVGLIVFTPLEK